MPLEYIALDCPFCERKDSARKYDDDDFCQCEACGAKWTEEPEAA